MAKRHPERLYVRINEPPRGARVAIYARYSSEMQDKETIETQVRRAHLTVESKGWIVFEEYLEPETSAKYEDITKRPQFARLLQDAKRGQFQVVLCYDASRWSRNVGVATSSLSTLKKSGVWWATYDDKWNSSKVQESGFRVAFQVELAMNEDLLYRISARVQDGKEDRALKGFHNGWVPWGYLQPDYDSVRPAGAPTTWRPPRLPARLDPAKKPIFASIAEWRLAGHSAREIAGKLNQLGESPNGSRSTWNKDGVTDLLKREFYREFEPGCGLGTIITPNDDRVMGQHEAAWDWDTWHRMDAITQSMILNQFATPVSRQVYPFAGILVCAACGDPCRAWHTQKHRYYTCRADWLGIVCKSQVRTTNAQVVNDAFGRLLQERRLGDDWREDLKALSDVDDAAEVRPSVGAERSKIERLRRALKVELEEGDISEVEYRRRSAELRQREATIPTLEEAVRQHEAQFVAGEQLLQLADAWLLATTEECRDIVMAMLEPKGLIWDHEVKRIVAMRPHDEFLPSLHLASGWREADGWLWSDTDPSANAPVFKKAVVLRVGPVPRRDQRRPPVPAKKLTPDQESQVLMLLGEGMSLGQVAKVFGVSRQLIHRLSKK